MGYTKLGNLIDKTFTVQSVGGFSFKKWDDVNKKMLTSDTHQEGYRKVYSIETDQGTLDLGVQQLGNLLQEAMESGKADINGKTYQVKSNGKTGMEIRYFLNLVKEAKQPTDALDQAPF